MKEAIGSTFLFNIVILFILLFTGIMTVTINRSKAFTVKDDIIAVIEKNNGVDLSSDKISDEIVEAMTDDSYRAVGTCPDNTYDAYDRDGNKATSDTGASICIQKQTAYSSVTDGTPIGDACYYQVIVFYSLDIPVLKTFFNFDVTGETKVLNGCES